MPSDQQAREERLEKATQELAEACEALVGPAGEDFLAVNRLITAVRRQCHAIMTVIPVSGVEAGIRDAVAGQIYHDPDDPRPCLRCGGSGIDPYFSEDGTGSYELPEPPVLEPCVACQFGSEKPAGPWVFSARVRMNHHIHAAQPWPEGVNVDLGAPLTACRMTVYRKDWYGDSDLVVTCGPCRFLLGIDR